ncbi:hypothetical protein O181_064968 [Austropuccinia psidii MF-1]|uniref:Reverse transcriptase Ty1/copia-type domain-containing protein n=1 Tax=Austropuccinia psidii MF-1 TaxID=1389203 RepID=A0A9Q3EUI8_9BASI|nr:hypothetical protein [Austropuccinia psidii MF-1]
MTKYKARLCVRGFNQREGLDSDDAFPPTGWLASLRLLLKLAHQHGFQIDQMDVQCAFLNEIPNKTLKKSPQFWHNALNNALLQIGLVPTKTDPCLYYLSDHSKPVWLFAHIDGLIFSGCWNEDFKAKIKTFLDMGDLGSVKYAPGIRITQSAEGISMIQDRLIQQILSEFNLENSQPLTSPLPSNINDLKSCHLEPCQHPPFHYQRAIGLLQYLVQGTCPNLAFSTHFMSQFLESPSKIYFQAIEYILKYLLGRKELTLKLGQNNLQHDLNTIIAFSNANLGGSKECKSFSGSLIYYQGAIGWHSHKQKVVSLSSAKVEDNALPECSQDLLWLKKLIYKISTINFSGTLFSDDQSAMAISSNQIYHCGTRHINFRLHFIRNLIEKSEIWLKYLPTTDMVKDSLTKNFPIQKIKITSRQCLETKKSSLGMAVYWEKTLLGLCTNCHDEPQQTFQAQLLKITRLHFLHHLSTS